MPRSRWPKNAVSVMYVRLAKASPPAGTYEKASATPVTTCMMKAQNAALPKTYHQRASRGTTCVIIGTITSEMPMRSSSQP
ncbi:MAG: hypothetical protein U0575_11095 [Phycisphaerales bacterium]